MALKLPISDPELLERQSLGDAEFERRFLQLAAEMPARPYGPEQLVRALGYPWERPPGPYLLRCGVVTPLVALPGEERRRALARLADPAERTPLLAIGSNASPSALTAKLADLGAEADRELLALSGRLHDFDVAAAAQPAIYGSLPATLLPSPGTEVEATLLWVTAAQLTRIAWTEPNYRLGELAARLELDEGGERLDRVAVFVSRFGCFAPDREPLALAAVPAEGRRATAASQVDLLDRAAALALGEGAGAAELVRAIHEDLAAVAPRIATTVWAAGIRFEAPGWRPLQG